jgi:hypothetical protein
MSAKKTKKYFHRAKDDLYYASFQEKVDANKRHIQQKLKEMGLDRSSFQKMRPTPIAKKKKKSSPVRQKTPLEATRRSSRVRKAPPENGGLPEDYMLEIRASDARKKRMKVYPSRTASFQLLEVLASKRQKRKTSHASKQSDSKKRQEKAVLSLQRKAVLSDETKKMLLEGVKKDAKKEFEQEREVILAQLPRKVKDMIGEIGFTKWGKINFPVLILSPYDVPPGEVRDMWREAFERVRSLLM